MEQPTMDFTQSKSPINRERLSKQNKFIYDHLSARKTLTSKEAFERYGISRLASRINELRRELLIFDKFVDEDGVKFKRYSLHEDLLK